MNTSALKSLTIKHLRGSVKPFTLPFERGKKLTLAYGENGSGKTTICDAFEFLGKGRVGSLEDRGLGKTGRYWHSIGKRPNDVAVVLETGDHAMCTATVHKGEVRAEPATARPRVEVLRRSQILSLVAARPADCYAAIKRFVDVSGVEAAEDSLRSLVRDLKGSRDNAVARIHENEDAIRQFWESAGKSGADPVTWATVEAERDASGVRAELDALERLRSAYQRLVEYPTLFEEVSAALQQARGAAEVTARTLSATLALAESGAGELVALLEAGAAYLEKHPHSLTCPLCESAEKASTLRQSVRERVERFESLRRARRENEQAASDVVRTEGQLEMLRTRYHRDNQAYESARAAYAWSDDIPVPEMIPSGVAELRDWLDSSRPQAEAWRKAEGTRQEHSQFLRTLQEALKTYRANVANQKDLDRLLPRLERALEVAMEERRTFTDAILSKIADDVGRLYEAVHPGEGLNTISLLLDPNKRASLEIAAKFAGLADAPPQAYFSQSHLDTLGLCVFLALASSDASDETILVLDDVLASVDEPHVERLIEMLYSEAIKFRHCFITTHYRPWKEKLRWGWLKHGQCHFVELTKWSLADGLQLILSVPDVGRLRQLLAEVPPDPQLVSSKAGVILEAALDFLTQLYECSVPRRSGAAFTLGDLLPSVGKKLRAALKVEVLVGHDSAGVPAYRTVALAPILDELSRIAQARNVFGCHFNTLSFELLEADALGFGRQVLLLVEALSDPEAGWPKSSKSGSYWANSGETRRLHPLKPPS